MKKHAQTIFVIFIFVSAGISLFSGYQIARGTDQTAPSAFINKFQLEQHESAYTLDYALLQSKFESQLESQLESQIESAELVDPSTTLPSNQNLTAQREIFRAAKDCFKSGVPKFSPSSAERKALIWEQFRCGKLDHLPDRFFDVKPFMHFSGQSYALMATTAGISVTGPIHLIEHAKLHDADPEWRIIAELSRDSLRKLNLVLPLVDDPKYILLRETKANDNTSASRYLVYDPRLWKNFLSQIGRSVRVSLSGPFDSCDQVYAQSCWNIVKSSSTALFERVFAISLASSVILLLGFLSTSIQQHRRRTQQIRDDRLLLARVTAHELRTPVTNLKLIASTLSRAKTMTDIQQITADFSEQIRRLTLLTDASLLLLETEPESKKKSTATDANTIHLIKPTESVAEIAAKLQELASRRGLTFEVSSPLGLPSVESLAKKVQCQLGMLLICVENLVDNALNHGKPPVKLQIIVQNSAIVIEVSDHGEFKTSKSSASGLGIGLDVAHSAMRRMGGTLIIKRNPTRIELSLRILS